MEIAFAFLADQAVLPPDGKFYVLGGGLATLALPELPYRFGFCVVAGFRFQASELVQARSVEVRLIDSQSKLVVTPATVNFPSGMAPDGAEEVTVQTVIQLVAMFGEPGQYAVQIWAEQQLMTTIKLGVRERQQPELGPRPN